MTETLNVEYEELMARAAELEVPLPAPPPEDPKTPCEISFIIDSGVQLAYSAKALRETIDLVEQECLLLAESLRNAALAYEEVDEAAADAVTDDTSVSSVMPRSSKRSTRRNAAMTADGSEEVPPTSYGFDGYYDLRQAAEDIEAPDQAVAYTKFANDWNAYVLTLQSGAVMERFRPFQYWEGTSAESVEANFEKQKNYLIDFANTYCYQLSGQVRQIVTTHKWAITEHPSTYDVYRTDIYYEDAIRRNDYEYQAWCIQEYDSMQRTSEEVLAAYYTRAGLPLMLVYPPTPPAAVVIDPPPPERPTPTAEDIRDAIGIAEEVTSGATPNPAAVASQALASKLTDASLTDKVGSFQDMVSGATDTSGDPMADVAAQPPLAGLPGMSSGGGVKPASLGRGGVPSTPMQPPPADAGLATQSAAARPTGAGAPIRAGGAMGGGMGGGAPMGGAPNQGQGKDGKGKRVQEDEDIYTEDRPWTSSVIGVRKRNDIPE